ncbi:hypothetical protein FKW77_000299 [Venturia effusa]|uniref:Uncharacterized protein n=1 Tax=Venturia effusa TaxID=50376 RepID=A0A517LJJ2_9PEZI|nr:hypothetical protein FKW77_000299 [Venturia effusa]
MILDLILHHLPFLALLLCPHFWTCLSLYHEEATESMTLKWQQLQLAMHIQMPPATVTVEESDGPGDGGYEQWVDQEIKRFQCVLRDMEILEEELRGAKKAGILVSRMRRWVEGIWELL